MSHRSPENASNAELLELFWKRHPFHDLSILEIVAINQRVLIKLREYTLITTGVTRLQRCETSTPWLYDKILRKSTMYELQVETDDGDLQVRCRDFRLLRNSDLAVLVPPLDSP